MVENKYPTEEEWQEWLVEFADYIKPGELEERGLAGNQAEKKKMRK